MAGNEPVAINSYPVTAAAVLADSDVTRPAVSFVTANAHHVSSMGDGQLELGFARCVLDAKGARFTGNRLITAHVRLAVYANRSAATRASRHSSIELANRPLAFVRSADDTEGSWPPFAALAAPLPRSIHLQSLQLLPANYNLSAFWGGVAGVPAVQPPVASGDFLVRLRHVYQAGLDGDDVARPETVDLTTIFAPRWRVASVVELVVDGSASLSEARAAQVQWNQATASVIPGQANADRKVLKHKALQGVPSAVGAAVTIAPMELRTFLMRLA